MGKIFYTSDLSSERGGEGEGSRIGIENSWVFKIFINRYLLYLILSMTHRMSVSDLSCFSLYL